MSSIIDCFNSLFKPAVAPPVPSAPKPSDTNVIPMPGKPGSKILGVDVSHYEQKLDWAKAKAGGVEFMYAKASEGLSHVDSMLRSHVDAAQAAQVYAGAYHFFHASMDGKAQALHFLDSIRGMSLDLPHVLDWESSSADGVDRATQMVRAQDFLDMVEKATNKAPVIYGGLSFLKDLKLPLSFGRYPLWLAHYGVSATLVPSPWSKFTMWQYTDAETVSGLAPGHHVDANWFNGDIAALRAFANK